MGQWWELQSAARWPEDLKACIATAPVLGSYTERYFFDFYICHLPVREMAHRILAYSKENIM